MSTHDYRGLAFIGDPHLSSHVPGFRRDDYPRTALAKLKFCLETALEQQLLPVLLGDVFDRPRDNANWLIGELLDLLSRDEVLAIYGNHDCRENSLTDDDSFSILLKSGHLRLLTPEFSWQGTINGQHVIVGGSPWGSPSRTATQRMPASKRRFSRSSNSARKTNRTRTRWSSG